MEGNFRCSRCGQTFRVPADEVGDHICPHCGLEPAEAEKARLKEAIEVARNEVYERAIAASDEWEKCTILPMPPAADLVAALDSLREAVRASEELTG